MATATPGGAYRNPDAYGGGYGYPDNDALFSAGTLRDLLAIVRANLWLIIALVGGAMLIALVLTLLDTPRFTATSTVQVNEQSSRVLGQNQDPNDEYVPAWDSDRFLQTQLDVLQSRAISQRVAKRLKLFDNAQFYKAMEATPPEPGTPRHLARESTIYLLQRNLQADLPNNSRIVSISFTSADPEFSAKAANAFATEFIAANLQRKFDSSSYARDFVSQQLGEAKTRLEASELAVNSYARQAGLIRTRDALGADGSASDPTAGGSVTTASLIQLNEAANRARAERIAAESRWRTVATSGSAMNAQEVVTNQSVQQLVNKRAEVQADLRLERAKHLDDHPTVIQLRAKDAELDRQLSAMVNAVRQSIKSEYDAALATEQDLARQVTMLKNDTLAEQQRSVQYNLLAREADTNRTIYDGLLQRYKELNAAAGITSSNIAVIDDADVPPGPSSPNLFKNLAIALMLGLGVAGGVVLLREQFDDAIRVPEDVETKLHLPLLGVVPRSEDELDAALADPKSIVTEAYNSLGGSLLYATTEGLPEVLLVTSSQPAEGKSTTSIAIASSFARIGKRAVLIDMDLRRPSIHHRFGFTNDRGMSDLLTSHDPVESALRDSGQPNLRLISSGPVPPSPTELIASPRMRALIEDLSAKFDVVVIDSSPILGLADAPLLSALVDGVLLVVEAERSRRGTLKSSLRRLRSMRPVILGAVLTKFDPRKNQSRYSEYYGYDYYQYRDRDAGAKRSLLRRKTKIGW